MPEIKKSWNLLKSDRRRASDSQKQTFHKRTSIPSKPSQITGSRHSIAKAVQGLTFLMNANDEAIDDLFNMLEHWTEITGRPFYTDQYLVSETKPAQFRDPPLRLAADRPSNVTGLQIDDRLLAKRAIAIIKERQLQFRDLPDSLRSEKYVRILLVLLVESFSGKDVRLTSIGYAIDRPQTSVLRYLQQLESHDLISRDELPSDGRVTLIRLTEKGDKLARSLVERAIETTA